MSRIKFYYDMMSQPCRALYLMLHCAGIPYEPVQVDLRKGQHMKPDFLALNPLHKVPIAVQESGNDKLIIKESCVIAKFLATQYLDPSSHWYPRDDIRNTLRVEEYLSWQHLTLRTYGSLVFIHSILTPMRNQTPPKMAEVFKARRGLEQVLDDFEAHYLSKGKFIAGDQISVADLFAISELYQPVAAGFDVIGSRQRLGQWVADVKESTAPHFDQSHWIVGKVRESIGEGFQQAYREFLAEKEQKTAMA